MATTLRKLQNRSAAHYLEEGPASGRLQTTVALVARTLGFPVAMINILDEDTQHTISLVGAGGPRHQAVQRGQARPAADL